jgi:hypothetical protein
VLAHVDTEVCVLVPTTLPELFRSSSQTLTHEVLP